MKMTWFKCDDGTFIRLKDGEPMTKGVNEKWDRQELKKLLNN